MAIVECRECGDQKSDQAPSCPNCGAVLDDRSVLATVLDALLYGALLAALGFIVSRYS